MFFPSHDAGRHENKISFSLCGYKMHLHLIPLTVASDSSSLKHVVLYNRKEKR